MDTLSIFDGAKAVYFDTNCFIYFLEHNEEYTTLMTCIFERIVSQEIRIVTSELTVAELLVHPYKNGRSDIAKQYKDFLTNKNIVTLVPIDFSVLDDASMMRGMFNTKLPDAIHLVSCQHHSADTIFLTNDDKIRGLERLKKVVLLTSLK